MATVTWASSSSTSWNTAANWSPSGVPGSGDDVVFDATSTVNCTLDVDAQTIASLDVQSGYTGTLDFADSGYNFAITGNFTKASGNTVDFGNVTLTCSGNFSCAGSTNSLSANSNETILNGSGKTLSLPNGGYPSFTISGTYSTTSSIIPYDKSTITGTLTCNTGLIIFRSVDVGATGSITGSKSINIRNSNSVTVLSGGSINTTEGLRFYDNGPHYLSGIVDCDVNVDTDNSTSFNLSGNSTINGDLTVTNNRTLTIAPSNYNLTLNGDFSPGTNMSWSAGTGKITLSGDVAQSIDFDGETVEDIEIDTTSTATLTGGVVTDSLTLTQGTLDVNAQALETTGNFTMAAGTTVTE